MTVALYRRAGAGAVNARERFQIDQGATDVGSELVRAKHEHAVAAHTPVASAALVRWI